MKTNTAKTYRRTAVRLTRIKKRKKKETHGRASHANKKTQKKETHGRASLQNKNHEKNNFNYRNNRPIRLQLFKRKKQNR
jgi:hypothetical protein